MLAGHPNNWGKDKTAYSGKTAFYSTTNELAMDKERFCLHQAPERKQNMSTARNHRLVQDFSASQTPETFGDFGGGFHSVFYTESVPAEGPQ